MGQKIEWNSSITVSHSTKSRELKSNYPWEKEHSHINHINYTADSCILHPILFSWQAFVGGKREAEDHVSIVSKIEVLKQKRQVAKRRAGRYWRMLRGCREGSLIVAETCLAEPLLPTLIPSTVAPDSSNVLGIPRVSWAVSPGKGFLTSTQTGGANAHLLPPANSTLLLGPIQIKSSL